MSPPAPLLKQIYPAHPFEETPERSNVYLFPGPRPNLRRSRLQLFLKRGMDIVFVMVFVALFWWLYIVVALGVRLASPGPLVFGHTRIGRLGKRFKCYKFRSMVSNAPQVLEELLAKDPQARSEWEKNFKLKDDPRITSFGNFIRRTSLDELPQLWNILIGDMSVVGPRPVTREEVEKHYGDSRRHYLSMRPGLTGPWQINGRNDTSYEERVAMDREYVENWSVMEDVKTVFRTIAVVFVHKGAY